MAVGLGDVNQIYVYSDCIITDPEKPLDCEHKVDITLNDKRVFSPQLDRSKTALLLRNFGLGTLQCCVPYAHFDPPSWISLLITKLEDALDCDVETKASCIDQLRAKWLLNRVVSETEPANLEF